jgi:hypothetical protein
MERANAQDWSNMLWAAAKLGCNITPGSPGDVSSLLSTAVAAVKRGAMDRAKPQEWSNMLWAAAKLGCNITPSSPGDVSSLLSTVVAAVKRGAMDRANAHDWSNLLWAAAKLGCNTTPGSHGDVSSLVSAAVTAAEGGAMLGAAPQAWANLLLGLADVGCSVSQLGAVPGMTAAAMAGFVQREHANKYDVEDTLVALGKLGAAEAATALLPYLHAATKLQGGHTLEAAISSQNAKSLLRAASQLLPALKPGSAAHSSAQWLRGQALANVKAR